MFELTKLIDTPTIAIVFDVDTYRAYKINQLVSLPHGDRPLIGGKTPEQMGWEYVGRRPATPSEQRDSRQNWNLNKEKENLILCWEGRKHLANQIISDLTRLSLKYPFVQNGQIPVTTSLGWIVDDWFYCNIAVYKAYKSLPNEMDQIKQVLREFRFDNPYNNNRTQELVDYLYKIDQVSVPVFRIKRKYLKPKTQLKNYKF